MTPRWPCRPGSMLGGGRSGRGHRGPLRAGREHAAARDACRRTAAAPGPHGRAPRRPPRDLVTTATSGRSRSTGWIVALVVLALLGALAVAYVVTNGFGTNTPDPGPDHHGHLHADADPDPVEDDVVQQLVELVVDHDDHRRRPPRRPPRRRTTPQLTRFVESYYRDVTKENKRDDTFAQLTPKMQQSSGRSRRLRGASGAPSSRSTSVDVAGRRRPRTRRRSS